MITAILKHAWDLYRQHFGVVAAVVIVIWLPLDLLSSYVDYFVFDPDDFRKSFKFARLLDNFVGIIATAGVISIGYTSWIGQRPSFRDALDVGVRSWGRMWWTRFLRGLVLVLGFLLMIIPGIYLLVRLALVEPIAVCERVSGSTAMRRSFELTRGHFWQVFFLGLVFWGLIIAAMACVVLPIILIPALDHWLVDAATALLADVIAAFATLCLLSAYVSFAGQQSMTEGPGSKSGPSTPPGSSAVTEGPPLVN
jgi:hypothetical protein